jgi:Lipoprotein confined to pathogenic Mycobacterium
VSRSSSVSRLSIALAGIMTILILAGCSSSPTAHAQTVLKENSAMAPRENSTMKDAFDELMKRPSLTAAEADYQSMLHTIQERLVTEVGIAEWVPDDQPVSGTFCGGDLSNLDDAGQKCIDTGVSIGNLPDARWDQAVAIVTEVAGQHGFGAPGVIVDGPGDHEISFRGRYEGELIFGTGGGTILTVSTGCHLKEEAHRRGTYLPPKVL